MSLCLPFDPIRSNLAGLFKFLAVGCGLNENVPSANSSGARIHGDSIIFPNIATCLVVATWTLWSPANAPKVLFPTNKDAPIGNGGSCLYRLV